MPPSPVADRVAVVPAHIVFPEATGGAGGRITDTITGALPLVQPFTVVCT